MTEAHPQASAAVALSQLKPKTKLQGRITRLDLYGAFVDVGADREGFVHLSMLRGDRVNKAEEVVQVGQEVAVWVHKVNPQTGKLELTMIEPLGYEWSDLKKGMVVHGKVVRLEKFGAFIDIGAERPGLVHISELSDEYVKSPSDVARVGDEVDAQVLEVDRKKRQIHLSLKALQARSEPEPKEDPQEPEMTAMQAAFAKAREASGRAGAAEASARARRASDEARRREQEGILARTLETSTRKQ